MTVFVDGDGKSASSDGLVIQRMEALQRWMRKYVDPGATVSLVDVIKQYWLVNHYADPKWGFVPDAAQTIGGIIFQLQRSNIPGFLRPFLTDDAEDANITFFFRDHKGKTIKRAVHYANEFINSNPMGRINVRLAEDKGGVMGGLYYLFGPVLFPRNAGMIVEVANINEDQKITGYETGTPVQVGRWTEAADPAEVEKNVVAGIRALSRSKLPEIKLSDRFKEDLQQDKNRMEKLALNLSAEFDYRIENISIPADEIVHQFETVGDLVNHIVGRSSYYVVEEWKNDEGNITAQTIRYCRHYCGYELWTMNTKFKDVSFNPQRTNTYTRGAEFVLAGGIMGVYAAVNDEVERGHVANIVLIFIISYLFVAISYRSNLAGLFVLFSISVATMLSLAYMAVRETGLTIQTLPVQSVGVGVGMDYAVYVADRIRQEYAWCGDFDEAIRRAIRTTGMAVCFTATTLIAGIIAWSFSELRFQAEMAQLLIHSHGREPARRDPAGARVLLDREAQEVRLRVTCRGHGATRDEWIAAEGCRRRERRIGRGRSGRGSRCGRARFVREGNAMRGRLTARTSCRSCPRRSAARKRSCADRIGLRVGPAGRAQALDPRLLRDAAHVRRLGAADQRRDLVAASGTCCRPSSSSRSSPTASARSTRCSCSRAFLVSYDCIYTYSCGTFNSANSYGDDSARPCASPLSLREDTKNNGAVLRRACCRTKYRPGSLKSPVEEVLNPSRRYRNCDNPPGAFANPFPLAAFCNLNRPLAARQSEQPDRQTCPGGPRGHLRPVHAPENLLTAARRAIGEAEYDRLRALLISGAGSVDRPQTADRRALLAEAQRSGQRRAT